MSLDATSAEEKGRECDGLSPAQNRGGEGSYRLLLLGARQAGV